MCCRSALVDLGLRFREGDTPNRVIPHRFSGPIPETQPVSQTGTSIERQAMAKVILVLGLVTNLAIFAIAVIGAPAKGGSADRERTAAASGCSVEEFALDEGYGVSRKALRRRCAVAE